MDPTTNEEWAALCRAQIDTIEHLVKTAAKYDADILALYDRQREDGNTIAALRSAAPQQHAQAALSDFLPGQLPTDIPWQRAQPDMAFHMLKNETVFDADQLLRTWNAMRNALIAASQQPAAAPSAPAISAERIQWKNINHVLREVAKFCFESKDHPQYGSAYTAVVTCLSAKDGLQVTLDPLPAAAPADGEPDQGDTVLRVQAALGCTDTGWISPDVILLRIEQLKASIDPWRNVPAWAAPAIQQEGAALSNDIASMKKLAEIDPQSQWSAANILFLVARIDALQQKAVAPVQKWAALDEYVAQAAEWLIGQGHMDWRSDGADESGHEDGFNSNDEEAATLRHYVGKARAALAAPAPVQAAPVGAKPFAYFVQPSGFGPFIECESTQAGSFPAYRALDKQEPSKD